MSSDKLRVFIGKQSQIVTSAQASFIKGYINAILTDNQDDDGNDLIDFYGMDSFAPAAAQHIFSDCIAFFEKNDLLFVINMPEEPEEWPAFWEEAGATFWLTKTGQSKGYLQPHWKSGAALYESCGRLPRNGVHVSPISDQIYFDG